ncbi:nephrin-like [Macrobrachium rosenbergii]|uniref:nephrin-like n=1 Tax=Macrobrachium rosenbergii TaxID=79674 RepID=UPI0034D77CFB
MSSAEAWKIWLLVLGQGVLLLTKEASATAVSFDATDLEADTSMVEVVEGYNASLPCSIRSPPTNDVPALTLWYIGDQETPVYSYDQREPRRSFSWADETVLGGGRARYLPLEHPPVLMLTNVSTEDQKTFRCRVDYHKSNSRQAWVRLIVIVPPSGIEIIPQSSPVKIGQRNDVVCRVTGGSPLATVEWLQEGRVVDVNSTPGDDGSFVYNSLEVAATRGDLTRPFTCKASNNKFTTPLISSYTRNVTCGPLSVKIVPEENPLVAGRSSKLVCTVFGSNPPPLVTWYQQGQEITTLHTQVHVSENMTVSSLLLKISRHHHAKQMVCRAEHPTLPLSTIEDIFTMDVLYKPKVTLSLGRSLNAKNLREGNDIFFECQVDANPPPYKVSWLHQNEEILGNLSAGILVSESTLALQRVHRQRSGEYVCLASNVEGDSRSNVLNVRIKYAPRCVVSPSLRGVALTERTNITCAVDADPANVTFTWTFNNSVRRDQSQVVTSDRYSQEGLKSVLVYTPVTEREYGTLFCFATNEVGSQIEPCSFTIISAGPPEEVSNCTTSNITSHSAGIHCLQGFDGGLPQRFLLQVWEMETNELVLNLSNALPSFYVKPLEAGHTYSAKVTAYNSRGLSPPSRVIILTLEKAEMHKSLPSMVPLVSSVFIIGVSVGIILIVGALFLTALWCVKKRENRAHSDSAFSQIVLKDNNPDLISVETSEGETQAQGSESLEGMVSYTQSGNTQEISSYQRYDEQDTSLYGAFSSETTRTTAPSGSKSRIREDKSFTGGGGGGEGRGGGGIGGDRGGKRESLKDTRGRGARKKEEIGEEEEDLSLLYVESGSRGDLLQSEGALDSRRHTKVRLYRRGKSPDALL